MRWMRFPELARRNVMTAQTILLAVTLAVYAVNLIIAGWRL